MLVSAAARLRIRELGSLRNNNKRASSATVPKAHIYHERSAHLAVGTPIVLAAEKRTEIIAVDLGDTGSSVNFSIVRLVAFDVLRLLLASKCTGGRRTANAILVGPLERSLCEFCQCTVPRSTVPFPITSLGVSLGRHSSS